MQLCAFASQMPSVVTKCVRWQNKSAMKLRAQFILEISVGRTRVCIFLASQQGERRQHAHCLQRRINDAGASKKCAILFVATFTHAVNFETSIFLNIFIALPKFDSGQLLFLGLTLLSALSQPLRALFAEYHKIPAQKKATT